MRNVNPLTKEEAAQAFLEQSFADRFDEAEAVQKAPNPTAPISIRLSAPLLKKIDLLAESQGRTRSNLIQRILWEHIRSQG